MIGASRVPALVVSLENRAPGRFTYEKEAAAKETLAKVRVQNQARAWRQVWIPMGRLGTPADAGNAVDPVLPPEIQHG